MNKEALINEIYKLTRYRQTVFGLFETLETVALKDVIGAINMIDTFNQKRQFAVAKGFEDKNINKPVRSTEKAAGYDFECAEDTTIKPWEVVAIPTGIKAYMPDDEVLKVYFRSSTPERKGLLQANGVGLIDADHADNPINDGLISVLVLNFTGNPCVIKKGERIAQGVFEKFEKTNDDEPGAKRTGGGFGSTGR